MSRLSRRSVLGLALTGALFGCRRQSAQPITVRCAVIGGMTKTGLWPELARKAAAEAGIASKVVVTGSRDVIAPSMREGRVDLITMHASDTIDQLVRDGFAMEPFKWAQNEHVIVGPKDDPAKIRGVDAAEAIRRIVSTKATIVLHGKAADVLGELARSVNLSLGDTETFTAPEGARHADTMAIAAERHAYSLVGKIPFAVGEAYPPGMELLVDGDRRLRKSYVVAVANPKRWPAAHYESARALSSFLRSPQTQSWLVTFGRNAPEAGPLFFPVST